MELSTLKDFLAVVGGVSALLAAVLVPLGRAFARQTIHGAIADAPAMVGVITRLGALEAKQSEVAEEVRVIPELATVLRGVQQTLRDLNDTLREARLERTELRDRVARLEGAAA